MTGNVTFADLATLVQALALIFTAGVSLLSWLQSRHNSQQMVENTKLTAQTHDLVNGQSELLKTAAYDRGVSDEKRDSAATGDAPLPAAGTYTARVEIAPPPKAKAP